MIISQENANNFSYDPAVKGFDGNFWRPARRPPLALQTYFDNRQRVANTEAEK